jgi:inner membrane protein
LIDIKAKKIKKLAWFNNNYYRISKSEISEETVETCTYTDLRYPMLNPDDINTSIVNLTIFKENKVWNILPFKGNLPSKEDFSLFF